MNIRDYEQKKKRNVRSIITFVVLFAMLAVYSARLVKIQIVDAEKYAAAGDKVTAYSTTVTATRGEILDRNGKPLVINRSGNSVVFIASYFPSKSKQEQRNQIIDSLIKLFEQSGTEYNDTLPITINADGSVAFMDDKEKEIKFLKSKDVLNLNDYATAQNCVDALIEKFLLQEYPMQTALKIASVCFALKQNAFSVTNPYTFAEDVSAELAAKIKENSAFYTGVEIEVRTYRDYTDGTLAAHILGTVGAINSTDYESKKAEKEEKLKDKNLTAEEISVIKRSGYGMTSMIGESGIEQVMESYLRGVDGEQTITTDADGNTTTEYTIDPQKGDTVILTIDADLQKVAQDSLERVATEISGRTKSIPTGTVMAMDINTGEILVSASYPSYNLSTYKEDYFDLLKTKGSPLWNRALLSTYQPGSTIKPAIAISALDAGILEIDTKITCTGIYTYFSDMYFKCLGHHGSINVTQAIYHSCNSFFYETGRRLGIAKISEYLTKLGLGQKTGVELPETAGMIASAENREANGGIWNPGDTVQASIGQSDHLLTPIQLMNYVATLANGGTRYVPHFIKTVMSSDYSKTVLEKNPEVAQQLSLEKSDLDAVRLGMNQLCTTGACQRAFSGLSFGVAAKTGTSQVVMVVDGEKVESNNGFLISYAPYENPEIAVVVVVENATSGASTAPVAADIYNYYFSNKGHLSQAQDSNTLLQ